jgi:hypothetical protein
MLRLDRQARELLRNSVPLLESGRKAKAAALVDRAVELMERVSALMEQNRQWIHARIAALEEQRAAREGAEPSAEPEQSGG